MSGARRCAHAPDAAPCDATRLELSHGPCAAGDGRFHIRGDYRPVHGIGMGGGCQQMAHRYLEQFLDFC